MRIFASVDPANLPNRDPQPYRHEDGSRSAYERKVIGGFTRRGFYHPRLECAQTTTHPHNPILASLRDCESGHPDVAVLRRWADALDDPEESPEVQAVLDDMLGFPAGPGWEDRHWYWVIDVARHAHTVIDRLIELKEATADDV